MIERYTFIKLKSEFATESARLELQGQALEFANIPLVAKLTAGVPDAEAESAWDLSCVAHFDDGADVRAFLEHPDVVAFFAGVEPKVAVMKAWSFHVESRSMRSSLIP